MATTEQVTKRSKRPLITIDVICKGCGKAFKAIPSEVKRGKSNFCNRECYLAWRKRNRLIICEICNKSFERHNAKRRFCSRACFEEAARKGTLYKYTTWLSGDGYSMQGLLGRTIPIHRLIVEQTIGRPLKRHEVVHHVNGNKLDNRKANLLLCTQAYHRYLHDKMASKYMEEHYA